MSQKHIDNRNDYQTPALLSYVQSRMAPEDERHQTILNRMRQLPPIQIGPGEGKILQWLAQSCQAKKAVEIGTLGGYSALWIADALPAASEGGKLYTLEIDPAYAALAQVSFEMVKVADKISIVIGDAHETLKTIESDGPFDFCFIDADKIGYPHYLRWAASNLRKGGVVAADNAYLFGKLHLDPETAGPDAPAIIAMQEFIRIITDRTLFSTAGMIPTGEGLAVGIKS